MLRVIAHMTRMAMLFLRRKGLVPQHSPDRVWLSCCPIDGPQRPRPKTARQRDAAVCGVRRCHHAVVEGRRHWAKGPTVPFPPSDLRHCANCPTSVGAMHRDPRSSFYAFALLHLAHQTVSLLKGQPLFFRHCQAQFYAFAIPEAASTWKQSLITSIRQLAVDTA